MSTVTISPTVDASNVPPRVRLDITSADATSTTITRINPDGTTTPVRTQDGLPLPITGGTALLYDYEAAPYGVPVSYSSLESPATASVQVTIPETRIWLIHPGVPALSVPVQLYGEALMEEAYAVQRGVFHPLGRSTPVIVTDGTRRTAQSSLTILTETLGDLAGVRQLIADASPLLLNIPDGMGLGFDSQYIGIADVKVARLTAINADPSRVITMPFDVVDRPAGGSQAQRTYVDILANFATYDAVRAHYATYTALLAGP